MKTPATSRGGSIPALRARLGWRIALCAAAACSAIVAPQLSLDLRAGRVLLHLMRGPHAADTALPQLQIEELQLQAAGVRVRARSYAPIDAPRAPGLVLLHGVHPLGIDEPRLVAFARALAGSGISVLTPEIVELTSYRIDADTIQRIAALARLEAGRLGVPAVGVMGISFAGGLALIAAANARDSDAIAFVVGVGAHHDLSRLARYYAGDVVAGPRGEHVSVAPHPYGARVMLREHLDRFFAAADVPPAREALDTYLHDRHALARKKAQALSPAGRRTMSVILDERRHDELARMLQLAAAAAGPELDRASPRGQLQALSVPVFLAHGVDDPIIPSTESLWLEHELPARVQREVVITPLLRHAEFPRAPTARETLVLVRFMADVLRATDAEHFTRPRTGRAR